MNDPVPIEAAGSRQAAEIARGLMLAEARSIERAAELVAGPIVDAIELIRDSKGRVLVSGLGKSGYIAAKIAATFSSTGTPAHFVHATEALHGDSGSVGTDDVAILISHSGETREVCEFAQLLAAWGVPLITMTSHPDSTLARLSSVHLDMGVEREADPLGLAPTASTAVSLAIGDALAAALMTLSGFTADDFATRHPGGSLGQALSEGDIGGEVS